MRVLVAIGLAAAILTARGDNGGSESSEEPDANGAMVVTGSGDVTDVVEE